MKREQLKELLCDMSMDEKIGQLLQLSNDFYESDALLTGPSAVLSLSEQEIYQAGSVLSVFEPEKIKEIQTKYMKKQPHHIPLLFMGDIINGYKTIFPIPLAQGCTFNPEMVKKCAEVSARETAAAGLHVTFSPMVDLVRDARWGRDMESTGEDSYLNSCMAKATVEGYQGDDLSEKGKIAACVKHFAAYGMPMGAREYNNVELSERTLREQYLPAYKAGIDAGAAMVMTSFNTLNHIPSTGNKWLLKKVLREEMGFDGVLISDWAAIEELLYHRVAKDQAEAARLAMEAGVDIDMVTGVYIHNLINLVKDGIISEIQIDEAVMRVLELKNKLGLFENPFKDLDISEIKKIVLSQEHRQVARQAAAESMVLLENDGILPLASGEKVAVIGPYADNKHLFGVWSLLGKEKDTVSIKEGILNRKLSCNVSFSQGAYVLEDGVVIPGFHGTVACKRSKTDEELLEEAVLRARSADKVVLALGEHAYQSGEGGSRADITITACQLRLLREISKVNDNIVVILFHGRPLDIREIKKYAKAILLAWFPGTEGGNAIADILYGDVNPSARLSMSFPYCVGQVPVFYNEFSTGRPYDGNADNRFQSRYQDIPNEPLYPFGYGLSYSKFEYSKVTLSRKHIGIGEEVTAFVTVTNTGAVSGTETVQMYIHDVISETVRPVRELKGFCQIHLAEGESTSVQFVITEEMLKFYDMSMDYICEPGTFKVFIGGDSTTENSEDFEIVN